MNNVLITGNKGYVGTVLAENLLKSNKIKIEGLDINFYNKINYNYKYSKKFKTIIKDIRDIKSVDLKKYDTVIHLAALSNDPLGEMNDSVTVAINQKATINFAKLCKKKGVSKFIYIASLSMYGTQSGEKELKENETSESGITAYAKTKFRAEKEILKLNSNTFLTISLRPATVFGPSPNFRSDIVYNNLLLNGFLNKKIILKSSGNVWRPIIFIEDMCKVILFFTLCKKRSLFGTSYNLGMKKGNFKIVEMAKVAKNLIKNCKIIIENSEPDARDYKISFEKLYKILPLKYHPKNDLIKGGKKVLSFFKSLDNPAILLEKPHVRIKQLQYLINKNKINKKNYRRYEIE